MLLHHFRKTTPKTPPQEIAKAKREETDWLNRYPEGIKALSALLAAGKIKYRESVVQGIENAPQGLVDLLQGKNFGKQLVKLA